MERSRPKSRAASVVPVFPIERGGGPRWGWEGSGATPLQPVPWLTSEEQPALATAAGLFCEALGRLWGESGRVLGAVTHSS